MPGAYLSLLAPQTIMNIYAQRTHGTYVENKGSALLWQFRDADPEFGWLQSKEMEDHLTTVLKPFRWERRKRGWIRRWPRLGRGAGIHGAGQYSGTMHTIPIFSGRSLL